MNDRGRPGGPGRGPSQRRGTAEVTPWPGWVRYTLLTVLFAVIGVGLVVAAYDRGILPIAGPFAAMALAPLIGALTVWWLVRRNRGLSQRITSELQALLPVLEHERSLGRAERASGATDETLDAATRRARSALSQLAWGRDDAAVDEVDKLGRVAAPWAADSPAATRVGGAVTSARRLQRSRRRLEQRRSAR